MADATTISKLTESILRSPFEWCNVKGGEVNIEDASYYPPNIKGTSGGVYTVSDFAMAKYPITNAQYQQFIDAADGQSNNYWWTFSAEAAQWWQDRPYPRATAFAGATVPRTRVSWFDSMAFCAWFSTELKRAADGNSDYKVDMQDVASWPICLPTEQEWQRAAVGDSGWVYPWGNDLSETRANYGDNVQQVTEANRYPDGQSLYGVMDMVGNLAEWLRTVWGKDSVDVHGYVYRAIRGGAWNVYNAEYLRAVDRTGTGPRGQLNDVGFRCAYYGGISVD